MLIFRRKCTLGGDLKFKANHFGEHVLHMFLLYLGTWGHLIYLLRISPLDLLAFCIISCTRHNISIEAKADFFLTFFLTTTSSMSAFLLSSLWVSNSPNLLPALVFFALTNDPLQRKPAPHFCFALALHDISKLIKVLEKLSEKAGMGWNVGVYINLLKNEYW